MRLLWHKISGKSWGAWLNKPPNSEKSAIIRLAFTVRTRTVPSAPGCAYGADREQSRGKEEPFMHQYELVCIAHPDLDENAFKSVIEKVSGWVAEASGTVEKVDIWGRRRMAYQIRKHREGQYVMLNISMPPAAAAELERNLRFQENILRSMLTVVG
jgi:small subunit ribosomal protein S6